MLPKDVPKWRMVHTYFQIWSQKQEDSLSFLEETLKKYGYLPETPSR
jgi:hypothetical protein